MNLIQIQHIDARESWISSTLDLDGVVNVTQSSRSIVISWGQHTQACIPYSFKTEQDAVDNYDRIVEQWRGPVQEPILDKTVLVLIRRYRVMRQFFEGVMGMLSRMTTQSDMAAAIREIAHTCDILVDRPDDLEEWLEATKAKFK